MAEVYVIEGNSNQSKEESDSSGSEYDETDVETVKKFKRKILQAINKITPIKDSWDSTKVQNNKLYGSKSSDVYDFTHENRGLCLIINNDFEFTNMQSRPGSIEDVYALDPEFRKHGFHVKIYNNLSAARMDKKLRKASQKYHHEESDCFVCIISSHGNEYYENNQRRDMVLGNDGQGISIKYIMEIFNDSNCPGLMGKPRLFFIQACRGEKEDRGVDIKLITSASAQEMKPITQEDSSEAGPLVSSSDNVTNTPAVTDQPATCSDTLQGYITSPCYLDSMVMFSSPPGFYAFRGVSGSWFLQSLAKVLKHSVPSKSLQKQLTHVSYEMAMNYKIYFKENYCKNVPCVISMLTKDIYFAIR